MVDEQPILRKGLVELIQSESNLVVCGECATFAEAYAMVDKEKPDLVVTEISLKRHNGLELMKDLNFRWPDLNMLAFSMHEEEIYAERALRAGAKGYVSKESPPQDLLNAIQAIFGGKIYLSKKMSDKLLGSLVGSGGKPKTNQSSVEALSDRELEVFQHLGKGLTTIQIAEMLCLSSKTIETYREHIKRKLLLKSSLELICYAVEWSVLFGKCDALRRVPARL